MDRDKLRSATLGSSNKFKKETVEINGNEFEIRQPTLKQRGELSRKAMKISTDENGKTDTQFDIFEFQIQAVLSLTYVPKTDEKVFDERDRELLEECPAGGWFDKLSKVASRLANVSEDETKKNLDGTEANS